MTRSIRTIVYKIEDAVEYYTAQTSKHKNVIVRYFTSPAELLDVAKYVAAVTEEFTRVKDLVVLLSGENRELETMKGLSRDKVVVGFQEEQRTLINRLREEKEELDVMCIVGMPGLGKTTLAYSIFTDPEIESAFTSSDQRIWVPFSHDYQKKDVLLSILRHFSEVTDKTGHMAVEDISQLVRQQLCALDSFFVVMDDVPSAEAWNDLKGIFSEAKKSGKVLITTQLDEVARCSNVTKIPLYRLTSDESWELLQSEAFDNSVCPPELEQHGKRILEKCDRLPLSIVMIGKILNRRCSLGATLNNQRMWEQVSERLGSCLEMTDFQKNANISFYYKLPYHLRPCFLYLGMFPSLEIKVRTLTRLWIAEGFVREMGGMSVEQTADQYLNELINRNLVSICGMGPDGDKKNCRIHCILWAFCRKQASFEGENIFPEMFEPSTSNLEKHRRLCIDSKVNEFFSSRPSCPLVHSLTCFYKDHLHAISISSIPKVLKYLRVLEANDITFQNLPNSWKKLALLRCVVLSINFKVIPKVISKLRNMQTLIVSTTLPELEMEANVWKMSKLRNVQTNVSTKLPKPKEGEEGNLQLRTLGMISQHSCAEDVFRRLRNLQKLGIQGKLATLVPTKLHTLDGLEKLKLVNDLSGNNPTFGDVFPPNLRSLTLKGTKLDWNQMLTLGNLKRLEVLKLKDNAFKGGSWEASAGGFSQLQILHIVVLDEPVTWTASVNPFPILRCLMLTNTKLEEIPLSLGGDFLKKLCLKDHAEHSSVVASARRIQAQKSDLLVDIS